MVIILDIELLQGSLREDHPFTSIVLIFLFFSLGAALE